MDTPETPKTIIHKLKTALTSDNPQSLTTTTSDKDSDDDFFSSGDKKPIIPLISRPLPIPVHHVMAPSTATANVNPFTPDGMLMNSKKRARIDKGSLSTAAKKRQSSSYFDQFNNSIHSTSSSKSSFNNNNTHHPGSMFSSNTTTTTTHSSNPTSTADSDDLPELCQAPKRLALQDTNISRYEKEFVQLSVIGAGEFGEVFRCLNRLDGCIYAVKKSKKPVAGSAVERIALNEVWAHAVLGKHDNVVRYYSAWAENNHMLIQNEYCDGGSLQSLLQERTLAEPELRLLVLHIAEGLRYIHSNDLVHLDLKAGNIFLTKTQHRVTSSMDVVRDDGFVDGACEEYERAMGDQVTYKIGDLGHVTSVLDPDVEEGDCRYLPAEILHEDFGHLQKADIFALGITLFEAAGGGPLPKNGTEWHMLRTGQVPRLTNLSAEFNDLIALMTHPDATQRPSATTITRHPLLCSEEAKSKSQLAMELTLLRQKNEMLQKQLTEAKKKIKSMEYQQRTPGECICLWTTRFCLFLF